MSTKNKKYTKEQDEERYKIIKVEKSGNKYMDDCINFVINLEQLSKLIKKKYVNLQSRHNNSPTIEEFYNFVKDNKINNLEFEGFITCNKREDRGIYLNGLHGDIPDNKLRQLINFANRPDEFYIRMAQDGYFRLWWD